MKCYICEHEEGPGGTRLGIREALGVCTECGIGICEVHGRRAAAGAAFRCPDHAAARPVADGARSDASQVLTPR